MENGNRPTDVSILDVKIVLYLGLMAFFSGLVLAIYMPLPLPFVERGGASWVIVNWAVWVFIVAAVFYGLVMIAVRGRRRLGRYEFATREGIWDTFFLFGGAVVVILFGFCLVGSVEKQSELKEMAMFGAATAVGIVTFGVGLCRFIRYSWVLLRRAGEMKV